MEWCTLFLQHWDWARIELTNFRCPSCVLRTLGTSVMPFSPQQVHSDNIPQKSTPSSDIHVDWATEAMLQEIQCIFGLLFGGLKSTSISALSNMPLQVISRK